jgi:hypothetical protein
MPDFMFLIEGAIFAVVIACAASLIREEKAGLPRNDVIHARVKRSETFARVDLVVRSAYRLLLSQLGGNTS